MCQDALLAELEGEALEGPLEAEEDHLIESEMEAEDSGESEEAEDAVGEGTEAEQEALEALRSALQRRYEEVQMYAEQSSKAVLSAQARQMTALSSPALEMLVRKLPHLPKILSMNSSPLHPLMLPSLPPSR